MKLGIYLKAQHPAEDDPARRLAEIVEQVRLIRSLGFDSIWGGEHHATPGFHYFPLLPLLHRLAPEAEGLWVGTNLVLLPLHNPVEVAEVGAFLGGRGHGSAPPVGERACHAAQRLAGLERLEQEVRRPLSPNTDERCRVADRGRMGRDTQPRRN